MAKYTVFSNIISGSSAAITSLTGSLLGTASYAATSSVSVTSSYAVSSSYAATSSFANNFTVGGTLTAQTIVVQTITSSVAYDSGSNRFGSLSSNTQTFTGSVGITGSLSVSPGVVNSLTSSYAVTASYWSGSVGLATTASYVLTAQTASYVATAQTASYVLQAVSASYALTASYFSGSISNAISASYATTASYALNGGTGGTAFPYSGSAVITGSLTITGSLNVIGSTISGSFIGDGSQLTGLLTGGKTLVQSTPASTWTFNHNINYQWPNVTVYDSNNNVVLPQQITATSANTLTITFGSPVAGYAIASLGGLLNNYSTTGSNTFVGDQTISGSVNITGSLSINGVSVTGGGGGGVSFPYTGSATITGSLIVIGPSTLSGSVISGIGAPDSDYSLGSYSPFSRVTPITYTNYGTASLVAYIPTGSYDDFSYGVLLPFSMSFFDKPYTQVFIGSNSYLTFGAGSTNFSSLGPANPAIPGIHVGASDNAMNRLLTGSEAGNTFRIRFEGNDRSNNSIVYSWVFTSGSNTIQLHVDTITTRAGAVTGVTTGSVSTTNYANVDPFDFPSLTTTSSVAYSITTSTGSYVVPASRPDFSNAEGYQTVSLGLGSHAEGYKTKSSGIYSHAEGTGSISSGSYSHAEGILTNAKGLYSHAEGTGSIASGSSSHAEGKGTIASGFYSHAEGSSTKATGEGSHAEGFGALASGLWSHAEGNSTAAGLQSHAEGNGTVASGENSHAEGVYTTSQAYASHAEGSFTTSVGSYSHTEGFFSRTSGDYSHAEGLFTIASGSYSHAEGSGSIAIGSGSHAEGAHTIAFGIGSHAEGSGSVASGSYQHVSGRFNLHGNTTSLVVVGNGTSSGSRSDILRINPTDVQITGSLALSGSLTIASGSITMPNRPAFRVTGSSSSNITSPVTISGSLSGIDYNQGGYYNSTNGKFTAPIAGLYQVYLNARVSSINAAQQAIVYKNTNVVQLMWESSTNTGAAHFGVSGIVNLAVNDTLEVKVAVGSIQFDPNDSWGAVYIG